MSSQMKLNKLATFSHLSPATLLTPDVNTAYHAVLNDLYVPIIIIIIIHEGNS